mmetsp:Transcript_98142/g.248991  ORF Transcript_98142/g.248991 Transcript_98142/m.248991 type:complete len:344 (+) Transcript_98142:831-1862(+)
MLLESEISAARRATRAWASSIFAVSSSILDCLSLMEVLVFCCSRSHQALCSSSSFCSFASWKIIFSIMLTTWSKGPWSWDSTVSANFSRTLECICLASFRSSWMAFLVLGFEARSCKKATGEGGGTGFDGASVRTPPTFAKISTAALRDSFSLALVSVRSAHSAFLMLHADCVSESEVESASTSSDVLLKRVWASLSSPSASAFCEALSVLAASLALARLSCASRARLWELSALVSPFVEATSSSSNFILSSFSSSTTLLDLKEYFLTWSSLSPAAFNGSGSVKACSVVRCAAVAVAPTRAETAATLRLACCSSSTLPFAAVRAARASEMPLMVSFRVCSSFT